MPDRASSAFPSRPKRSALPDPLRRWWAGLPRLLLEETAALQLPATLPLHTDARLLAIGAQAPALLDALHSRVDFERAPLAIAASTFARESPADAALADAARLPLPAASIEIILLPHQCRHWDDDQLVQVLRDCWRVLTHNGVAVLWEVARSRSATVNAIWPFLLRDPQPPRLRSFAELGGAGRDAGFAWIQTLALRPFLWPPGPRVSVLMRKEHYTPETIEQAHARSPVAINEPVAVD